MSKARKINRHYKLTIETNDSGTVEITDPLTIEFTVTRNTAVSLNKGIFKIYNLGLATRTKLFQDRFRIKDKGTGEFYKRIILQAGYNQLSTIFVGNILTAFPTRQGGDIIMNIEAYDGLYGQANSITSLTLNKGTPINDVVDTITNDLQKVEKGVIASQEGVLTKSTSFFGNTFEVLTEFLKDKAEVFIDNEELLIMNSNQAFIAQIPLIKSETGLLSVPVRQQTYIEIDMIFEPRITVGQLVELESGVNPAYDGQYKVYGVTHNAIISAAVSGDAKTKLQLYIGSELLGGLELISKRA